MSIVLFLRMYNLCNIFCGVYSRYFQLRIYPQAKMSLYEEMQKSLTLHSCIHLRINTQLKMHQKCTKMTAILYRSEHWHNITFSTWESLLVMWKWTHVIPILRRIQIAWEGNTLVLFLPHLEKMVCLCRVYAYPQKPNGCIGDQRESWKIENDAGW